MLSAMAVWDRASPESMMNHADQCLEAARLVPPGRFYDEYRALLIWAGGYMALRAAQIESGGRGYVGGPYVSGAKAVRFWRTYLLYDPMDATGEAREVLVSALACTGDVKAAIDAATTIQELRADSADFSYTFACLLSIDGQPDFAYAWFENAVRRGYHDIAFAKKDPDLALLRRVKGDAFRELTRVKFEWSINWGIFNDDIVLVNRSPFAITNVVFRARIESGGRAWTPELHADAVGPGQSHTWENCISIPGSRYDKTTETLSCDQNR